MNTTVLLEVKLVLPGDNFVACGNGFLPHILKGFLNLAGLGFGKSGEVFVSLDIFEHLVVNSAAAVTPAVAVH